MKPDSDFKTYRSDKAEVLCKRTIDLVVKYEAIYGDPYPYKEWQYERPKTGVIYGDV